SAPEDRDKLAFMKFDNPVDVHIGMSVDPVDKTLPAGDSAGNNVYTRHIKDNFNINFIVDWTAANGGDYKQKVSLAIAGASLPDALVVPDETFKTKAAQSDLLYDLTDVFQKYASNQIMGIMETTKGRAMDLASYNGKMVSMPNVIGDADAVHQLMIRKDWLDKYKLDIPKTVDDVEKIAKVFLQEKPAGDDTVVLSGPDKTSYPYADFLNSMNCLFGFDPVFQAYDAYPGYWVNENGTATYGTLSPNTKSALERLAKWYQEGIIDPEMGTREKSAEPLNANQLGMFFGTWWSVGYGNPDSYKNDPTVNWQSYPIYSDTGKWNVHMKSVGSSFTLVNKNASEDVAKAVVIAGNSMKRDEGTLATSGVGVGWMPLRNVRAPADDVEHEVVELTKVLNGETKPEDYNDPSSIYSMMYEDAQIVQKVIPGYQKGKELGIADFDQTVDFGKFQRIYSMVIGDRPYATVPVDKEVYSITYSMTPTMEQKWANLKKMEDETVLKIITGKSDISAFDKFVTDWKAQGGDEILKEVQALIK
ncbi:MAG: hypothetical protein RSC76_08615, partial [Oscillospiraceae bacterium]